MLRIGDRKSHSDEAAGMLFALPEYDRAFAAFVHESVRELARARDPLLAQMKFAPTSGPLGSSIRDREGEEVEIPPGEVSYEIGASWAAIAAGDFDALYIALDEAAESLAKSLVGLWVGTMERITDATGNVVDAGGQFTFEVLYEALEGLEYTLDENDELVMPTLVMHPDDAKQLQELGPPTDEQNQKLAALRERSGRHVLPVLVVRQQRR